MGNELKKTGIYHFTGLEAAVQILSGPKLRLSGPKKIRNPEKVRLVGADQFDLNPKAEFDLNQLDVLAELCISNTLDYNLKQPINFKDSNIKLSLDCFDFYDVVKVFPEIGKAVQNWERIPVGKAEIKEAIKDYFKHYIELNLKAWTECILEDIAYIRIFCCQEVGDSMKMWVGYGDGGNGLCIRFRVHPFSGPKRVRYFDGNPLNFDVQDFLIFYNENVKSHETGRPSRSTFRHGLLEIQLIYKEKKWLYEREIRYLRYVKNHEDYHYENLDLRIIESIFLGPNVLENDQRRIINLCKGYGIRIYLTEFDLGHGLVSAKKIALL